jgi:hypothetical protein
MVSRISASFRLVLVAVLCGLNATCMVGASRGREVAGVHQVSLVRANPFAPDHLQHVSHLQPLRVDSRTSNPAAFSKVGWISAPTFAATLLARENVLTLGDAPRAPGLGRAPPPA